MTNLIPPAAKKQIVLEYWVRVISVWVIVWAVSLLVSAFVLLPTYVLIVGSSAAYADSVADASERTAAYESISTTLTQASKQAQVVVVNARQPQLSAVFADISNTATQGIELVGVSIDRTDTGLGSIAVRGEATDRQALAMFRDRLEALSYVESVDLPIENLAENRDIEFSLSILVSTQSL